jgi:hypothetical protein
MHNLRRQVGLPRVDATSGEQPGSMTRGNVPLPAWQREQLIRQFQGIDGSTRSEAERQIDAYERSFSTIFGSPPNAEETPGNAKR